MEREFELPVGLEIDGRVYRRGKVKALTMGDEIDIAGDPRVKKNPAYQMPLAFVRAITEFEDLPIPVDVNKILKLCKRDYLYLTNEISKASDEGINLVINCPNCGHKHKIDMDSIVGVGNQTPF